MKTTSCVLNDTKTQSKTQLTGRQSVGILGGGFNPVHMGHLIMADQVYHQLGLSEFYLMPSYQSPHIDEKEVIASDDRVEMLKLAIATNPNLGIELSEIQRKGKSYTYDTIQWLTEQHPDTDYYFVIGGDMVAYLSTWHRIDELVNLVQFVGVNRPGYPKESDYPIIWVDAPLMDVSSTMIRKKVANHCSVKYFMPDNVIDYIHKKGLYLNDND
ncbi:MAG: nicotinate-nucleotide adenylyltransferase [Vagococcus sp.]